MKSDGSLDQLESDIFLAWVLNTYDHLKAHWKPPSCLAIDVTGSVLNPESYEDAQIDSALLEGNYTTTDSRQYYQHARTVA